MVSIVEEWAVKIQLRKKSCAAVSVLIGNEWMIEEFNSAQCQIGCGNKKNEKAKMNNCFIISR